METPCSHQLSSPGSIVIDGADGESEEGRGDGDEAGVLGLFGEHLKVCFGAAVQRR